MPALVATPGDPTANSYLTLAEALDYFLSRAPVSGWENADDQNALLMHATRLIDALLSGVREWIPPQSGNAGYYRIHSKWTGAPATATQALAWPRIGMFNRNGVAIASNVIPSELKNAVAELAGALGTKDVTVDSDIAIQGITSVKAGSVSVGFAQGSLTTKMLPDAVLLYLVPSWMTDETNEGAFSAQFDVV